MFIVHTELSVIFVLCYKIKESVTFKMETMKKPLGWEAKQLPVQLSSETTMYWKRLRRDHDVVPEIVNSL